MALEFDVEIGAAVDVCQAVDDFACAASSLIGEGGCQRAFIAAGESDEAGGEFFEVVEDCCAFGLGGFAHFESSD